MDNTGKILNIILVLIVVISAGLLIRKIFPPKDRKEKKAEKETKKALLNLQQSLDANTWREDKNYTPYTNAQSIAKDLYWAMAGLGTNESKVFSSIEKIPTKMDVSYVSHMYAHTHKKSLYNDLYKELSANDFKKIAVEIESKPNK